MYVEGSQPIVHLRGALKRFWEKEKKVHLKRLRLPAIMSPPPPQKAGTLA